MKSKIHCLNAQKFDSVTTATLSRPFKDISMSEWINGSRVGGAYHYITSVHRGIRKSLVCTTNEIKSIIT